MSILRYGIISDTHGHVPAAVFDLFDGVERIYHCGDVGRRRCLSDLEALAPVRAVAGNMDPWPMAGALPESLLDDAAFGTVGLAHGTEFGHDNEAIVRGLLSRWADASPRLILFGHTHVPLCEQRDGAWCVNPGSASVPKRGAAGTVALLTYDVDGDHINVEHLDCD